MFRQSQYAEFAEVLKLKVAHKVIIGFGFITLLLLLSSGSALLSFATITDSSERVNQLAVPVQQQSNAAQIQLLKLAKLSALGYTAETDSDMSEGEPGEEGDASNAPVRPNRPQAEVPASVDYKAFTTRFDEEVAAPDLCDALGLEAWHQVRGKHFLQEDAPAEIAQLIARYRDDAPP